PTPAPRCRRSPARSPPDATIRPMNQRAVGRGRRERGHAGAGRCSATSFRQARVLVVGDAMLDRYWFGEVERISPEAPVPIVRIEREEERAGGAANVARNAAAL